MQKGIMVKSLVGTDFGYIQMQAYIREDENVLHIQAHGPQANRDYGISADISLDMIGKNMVDWLRTIGKHFHSMVSSDRLYFPCQMRCVYSTNRISFQIANNIHYNTPYGGMFTVSIIDYPDLLNFWNSCNSTLDKVDQENQVDQATLMVEEVED